MHLPSSLSHYRPYSLLTLICLILCGSAFSLHPTPTHCETLVPLHIVKGTNLITIARNYCLHPADWKILARVNHLQSPYLIYAGETLRVPGSILKKKMLSARVVAVQGKPELLGDNGQRTILRTDDLLENGQTIRTNKDEFVHIVFPEDKHSRVEPDTEITLDYLYQLADQQIQTGLFVNYGKIIQDIRKKLKKNEHVETRTAVAVTGVRGTEFRVKVPDSRTNIIETLSGEVTLTASGKQVVLNTGRGTKVTKDKPLEADEPLPVRPAPLKTEDVYRVLPVVLQPPIQGDSPLLKVRVAADREKHDSVFEQTVAAGTPLTLLTLADGRYQVFLTAINKHGFESIPSRPAQLYIRTSPAAPVISRPITGQQTFSPAMTVEWLGSELAHSYHLQLANDSEFTNLITDTKTTESQFRTDLLEPGTYYFRVQLEAEDGFTTLFSTPISWTVIEQPKMTSQDSSVIQGEEDITLQWSAIKNVPIYMLQVSRNKDFTAPVVNEKALTTPMYTVEERLQPGRYYVRMCAVMESGLQSPWTTAQILDIEPEPLGIEHLFIALGFLALIVL